MKILITIKKLLLALCVEKNSRAEKKILFLIIFLLVIISIGLPGCKKFVQVNAPVTSLASTQVYESNGSAAAVLTGIYSNMASSSTFSGAGSIGLLCGTAADELKNYLSGNGLFAYYTNGYTPANNSFWTDLYKQIYVSNAAIQGLSNSLNISPVIKNQLLGEAKFMRAFLHFYATNLFGDVPLVTTTNYQVNNTISRSPAIQVYQQIVSDLNDAQNLLNNKFVDPAGVTTPERIRPNKAAATALLARVYLYEKKWDSAEAAASSIISNTALYSLDTLNGVFLKNSKEAIWDLQSITPGYNTSDGLAYILTSSPGTGSFSVAISSQLLTAFETGDNRFSKWIGTYTKPGQTFYYAFKYKKGTYNLTAPITEYLVVLRLAEQYLIRAEARAQQGNISGASADLNMIRNRAGLSNITASDQSSIVNAILHEGQVELFAEWGHRWFDLKRTGNVDAVMGVVTPTKSAGSWSSYKALFPIPITEIQLNGNLKQNPGYN